MIMYVNDLNALILGKKISKIGDTFMNPPVDDVTFEWLTNEETEEDYLALGSDKLGLEWEIETDGDGVLVQTSPTSSNAFLVGDLVIETLPSKQGACKL